MMAWIRKGGLVLCDALATQIEEGEDLMRCSMEQLLRSRWCHEDRLKKFANSTKTSNHNKRNSIGSHTLT